MKGVIFNIFENFVEKHHGEEAWDKVLDESQVENDVFTTPKTYDDREFIKLVTTFVGQHKLPLDAAIRIFGKFAFPQFAKRLPDVVSPYTGPESFLLNLDGIVHVEVCKLMEGATPPKFNVKKIGENKFEMEYISKRNLCPLVEGLLEGLAVYYGLEVEYVQKACTRQGCQSCFFEVQFKSKK